MTSSYTIGGRVIQEKHIGAAQPLFYAKAIGCKLTLGCYAASCKETRIDIFCTSLLGASYSALILRHSSLCVLPPESQAR